jgi:hypothetical protein
MTIQPQKITIWQLNMHKSEEARDALVKHALNQKVGNPTSTTSQLKTRDSKDSARA